MKPRLYQRFHWWYCESALAVAAAPTWQRAWQRWQEVNAQRQAKLQPKGA